MAPGQVLRGLTPRDCFCVAAAEATPVLTNIVDKDRPGSKFR